MEEYLLRNEGQALRQQNSNMRGALKNNLFRRKAVNYKKINVNPPDPIDL
jgi:hypothetical protein